MSHTNRTDGSDSSKRTKSGAIRIDVPKEGTLYTETKPQNGSQRNPRLPGPGSSIGRNTLRETRSTPGKGREVSPSSFYGKSPLPSSSDYHTRGSRGSAMDRELVNSFSVGTPSNKGGSGSRTLAMKATSPDTSNSQHRNATRNGVQNISSSFSKGQRKMTRTSSAAIEISDSEEDEVEEENGVGQRGKPLSEKKSSLSPSIGRANFRKEPVNEAIVPNRIRRKSDSPTDSFRVARGESGEGAILVKDSQEEEKGGDSKKSNHVYSNRMPLDDDDGLDASRAWKLSGDKAGYSTASDTQKTNFSNDLGIGGSKPGVAPRILRQNGMKNKDGVVQVVKPPYKPRQLGNKINASLPKPTPIVSKPAQPPSSSSLSSSSTTSRLPHSNQKPRKEIQLARLGIFGVACLGEMSGPSVAWGTTGAFAIQWEDGSSKKSVKISFENIESFSHPKVSVHPTITIRINNPEEVLFQILEGIGASEYVDKLGKLKEELILLPHPNFDLDFDMEQWKSFIEDVGEKVKKFEHTDEASKVQRGVVNEMVDLLQWKEKMDSGITYSRPKPRPASNNASSRSYLTNPSQLPNRKSSRLDGQAVGSAEEDSLGTSKVDTVTKSIQANKDGTIQRLRYPFYEASGVVNVFQSDIDKLDDREFLNDTIIELGLKYLLEQIKVENPKLHSQIYVFSSFFYKRFTENKRDRKAAYEFVKKWTKKVDIFKKKYLVIPINERLHWYLAILVNPHYAIREVETLKGLYEPDSDELEEVEKEEERTMSHDGSEVDDIEQNQAEEEVESVLGFDGDVQMKERSEVGPLQEADSLIEDDDKMSIDEEEGRKEEEEVRGPFQRISSEDLTEGYIPNVLLKSPTYPVFDRRTKPSNDRHFTTPTPEKSTSTLARTASASTSDDDDDDVRYLHSNTSSGKKSVEAKVRKGISDGISNMGLGKMRGGGGGGTLIIPGESFHRESSAERTRAAQKRKAEEESDDEGIVVKRKGEENTEYDLPTSLPSPPRSRSGATYGGNSTTTFSRRLSTEDLSEKHKMWLKGKAVVCVFDSLDGKHKAVRTALREYLSLEYNDKRGGEIEAIDVELEHIDVLSPMQGNYCDCGLYLLHSFERFINDPKKLLREVIPSRNRNHTYWQADEAAKKREWWREKVIGLSKEWEVERDKRKAEKDAQKLEGKAGAMAKNIIQGEEPQGDGAKEKNLADESNKGDKDEEKGDS